MANSCKLLIIDDCAADRKVYRRYLSKDPHQSYEIIEAASAADGLALMQQKQSQVVLLDYCLPDMSGLEVLEQLQQHSSLFLPVIMLTGQGDEAIAVQAIKRGAQDYLVKQSLKADRLQQVVRTVLQQSFRAPIDFQDGAIAPEPEHPLTTCKSQLITTVSHEYRTPLASILAAASTLKQNRDRLPPEKQEYFLEMIEKQTRRLTKLVDDMLLVSQLELNKKALNPLPLDLLQFFADLMEEQRELLESSHELSYRMTGNTRGFWGDRSLLQIVFDNLMVSAIRYSPEGGLIEFHLTGKPTEISFSIRSQDAKIPEDHRQLLHASAHTVSMDASTNTGLGLAIAKTCIALHEGTLTVSEQEDRGLCMTVCLPKQPQCRRLPPTPSPTPQDTRTD